MTNESILWRRLDAPGHDACSFAADGDGWHVDGTAVFLHRGMPTVLTYHVACDIGWRTRQGWVRGKVGARAVEFLISAAHGVWWLNGAQLVGLDECVDLDLGFTPATNLLPIRRLALAEGQAGDARAAWLDVSAEALTVLPQRYERRSDSAYWYEAPTLGYSAQLEVKSNGLISKYPGLWEEEC